MEEMEEMTIDQKLDYLFSKINWKDSHLDSKAVQIMNNLKQDISKEIEEARNQGRLPSLKEACDLHFIKSQIR